MPQITYNQSPELHPADTHGWILQWGQSSLSLGNISGYALKPKDVLPPGFKGCLKGFC